MRNQKKEKTEAEKKALPAFFISHKSELTAALGILLFYGLLFFVGITCPIKFFTGVSCAGCGMTRAWVHVFRGDLVGAWSFHPLFWVVPLLIPVFLIRKRHPGLFKGILSAVVCLFLITYFLRMFDPHCDVVVFEPKNSVFYRLYSWLRSLAVQK